MKICESFSLLRLAVHRTSLRRIMSLSFAITAISVGALSSCGFSSSPWVEIESHSTNWQGISSWQPAQTTVTIIHTITTPVSPEGFFESKNFPKNAFVISQDDAIFSDADKIYGIRDKIADKDKRGSILLDSTERKAVINLEEEDMDSNGSKRAMKCPENGTYEIRKWIVDGVPKQH